MLGVLAARSTALLAALSSLACAGHSTEPSRRPPEVGAMLPATSSSTRAPSVPSVLSTSAEPSPTLLITDRAMLAALERRGLSLSARLEGPERANARRLAQLPRFQPLVTELERELYRLAAADPLAGVDVARYSHRLFDARFLRLPQATFELAGVVNRPDRAPFHADSCGETRLVYRLSYALDAERASKLPMTLGIELRVPRPQTGCATAAARWLEPASADVEARAAQLTGELGPLSPALTKLTAESARVVVNVQVVRWPSTVRPDLGGHAEYLLRSFRPDAGGALRAEALENTIDPARFQTEKNRAELAEWLREHTAEIDAGTPLLPEKFLDQRAVSVTPRGLNRLANRPFTAALPPALFAEQDFSVRQMVKSSAALLRRLDQLSCQGCHEARSVAGFHLLGEDAGAAPDENALALPISAHVREELPRRLRIARQMLAGAEPNFVAPFAERAAVAGGYGSHCSLGVDATFASWTCDAGLHCSAVESTASDPVGQCLPPSATVGDACEIGSVARRLDHRRDGMSRVAVASCGNMVCNRSAVGFPAGMCTASCADPAASCGAIAVLDSFNACLGRGDSFLSCIRGNTRPAGLRACDASHPCRDDYVCARAADGGVCLPPYFVFQLRVDGHSSSLR